MTRRVLKRTGTIGLERRGRTASGLNLTRQTWPHSRDENSCERRCASMKPETEEHLKKVEGALAEANHILAQQDYPDNSRTVIVIGLLATMIEHHRAMLRSEEHT